LPRNHQRTPAAGAFRQALLGHEDDLELDPVGIVEEAGVVARHVMPLLRLVLDLESLRPRPREPLVYDLARLGLEREVMESDRVTVVGARRRRLCLAQRERRADALAIEVPDGLAALADDLVGLDVAERREQLAVERQAPFERRDDEIEMVESASSQAASLRSCRAQRDAAAARDLGTALACDVVECDEEACDAEGFALAAAA
jgi:hypothetical protein